MKLSILTFSKDNLNSIFRLIKNVNDIASEIVIIDSSSKKNYLKLRRKCKKNERIKLFHYKALGYVEPFRMLGISKCTYEYIFYLDSDEFADRKLINYLKKINIPDYVSAFVAEYGFLGLYLLFSLNFNLELRGNEPYTSSVDT